jgi:hypothetical protein
MEKDYRDRVVEMVNVKASDLVLNHHNPSVHSDQQKIIMEEMLESTGFVGAIKGRRVGDKIEILDGHLRAQLAGEEIVPVLILDLNDQEADIFMLTYDPVAAGAKISRSKSQALRLKAVTLTSKTYEQIAERATIRDVKENEIREKIRDKIRDTASRITIGSVQIPVTAQEMDDFTSLIAQYGEETGSFIGFGHHLLKLLGATAA